MTAMGYNTVAMTWSDTYSSIQTGIVNGSVGQTSLGVYTNLRDVVNYFIPYNLRGQAYCRSAKGGAGRCHPGL